MLNITVTEREGKSSEFILYKLKYVPCNYDIRQIYQGDNSSFFLFLKEW